MNLADILTYINMAIMVALIIVVALQNKSAGLSSVFGGTGGGIQTRRGADKWLFRITIVLGVTFAALSLTTVLLNK